MKKTKKILATNYRVKNLYGDMMAIADNEVEIPFAGKEIEVKILNLFWTRYYHYEVEPKYSFEK